MGSGLVSVDMATTVGNETARVHHLVADALGLPREPGQDEVDHIDGDRSNNRVENLKWVTGRENAQASIDTDPTPPPPNSDAPEAG